MILAVDFDDTLFKYDPSMPYGIGHIIQGNFNVALLAKMRGHHVILWTCREEEALQAAVNACAAFGLHFDTVNQNVVTEVSLRWPNSRKVFADWYLDDKAINAYDDLFVRRLCEQII